MARRRRGREKIRREARELAGVLHVSGSGRASVETAEGTFHVPRGGVHEAMPGDEVTVVLSPWKAGQKLAHVRSVTHRALSTFIGTYSTLGPLGCVEPLDTRITCEFYITPEDTSPSILHVSPGDVVCAQIIEYPTRTSSARVTLERRLGAPHELDLGVEAIIASYGLTTDFPAAALAEAAACKVDAAAALTNDPLRQDLRGLPCVTIDPADARDFDDAIGAIRLQNGGFDLWVHIADVAHYVPWTGSIDNEAKRRTCSVYLADRVLPMLPEALCNEVCSLKPNEDRLAMSVRMELDSFGNVQRAVAMPSVIRSSARLSYDEVDAYFELGQQPCNFSGELADMLQILNDIRVLREKIRSQRGSIDFESREARVRLDEAGHPTGVDIREETQATGLVEEAMLLANECVATMLEEVDLATAFRVHESPSPDNLRACVEPLREMGVLKADEVASLVAGNPHTTARVLARASGKPSGMATNALLLRAQKRAIYLPRCEGHYALGAPRYCHFTSPIRRYPDLLVHRALKALLANEADTSEQRHIQAALPQLCADCSQGERTADAAARDSQRVKMAELLAAHVGEKFSGVVSGCTAHGLYVTLDDIFAEGLLPVRALGSEWFTFDEDALTLTGEESGEVWRLGRRVGVVLESTDPLRGRITFARA